MIVGKRGDTLIEVALAVGIFSMVAIAVAAVLNGSTSGAQTALETTVTREEIDTQAEAIRFIQTSYAVSKNDTENNKFYKLWHAMTDRAISLSNPPTGLNADEFLNYAPTSCQALYGDNSISGIDKAFIINPRALGEYTKSNSTLDPSSVVISKNSNLLQPANIYPRLIYTNSVAAGDASQQDALIDTNNSINLWRAEGIYVVAVQDQTTTSLIDLEDGGAADTSAFYDFYIRSCWYGTDAEQPSTISTVIRLYDPDVFKGNKKVYASFSSCDRYSETRGQRYCNSPISGRKVKLPEPAARLGWTFQWESEKCGNHDGGAVVMAPEDGDDVYSCNFQPKYTHTEYHIKYDLNPPYTGLDSSMKPNDQTCYQDETCTIASTGPNNKEITASGYKFKGWCTTKPSINSSCPSSSQFFSPGTTLPTKEDFPISLFDANRNVTLYAVWGENNEILNVRTSWTSNTDYDSYMEIIKPGTSNTYISAYWGTTTNDSLKVTYSGETYYLVVGQGDGRGSACSTCNDKHYEEFVVNTLGSKGYYYSVHNWSVNNYIGNDITVKVTGDQGTSAEFKSTVSNSCNYWNVFAYKDGKIIERNTCTANEEYGY